MYVGYYRSYVFQKTVNSVHLLTLSPPPPLNDDIAAIRLREIFCDMIPTE